MRNCRGTVVKEEVGEFERDREREGEREKGGGGKGSAKVVWRES